jgi:hypothetical protein
LPRRNHRRLGVLGAYSLRLNLLYYLAAILVRCNRSLLLLRRLLPLLARLLPFSRLIVATHLRPDRPQLLLDLRQRQFHHDRRRLSDQWTFRLLLVDVDGVLILPPLGEEVSVIFM